jgi:Pectate lyase superfamily protein
MDRRDFMGLGGVAALLGAGAAEAAPAPSVFSGKTVLDFGVVPDSAADQSDALQKAINAQAEARQPIVIPAGSYRAEKLVLPSNATVLGVPGLTVLAAPGKAPVFETPARDVSLRGLTFSGFALMALECRNLSICDCQVLSSPGTGFLCMGTGIYIAGNRAASCARAAIEMGGQGVVTNNVISGPGQMGIRLGGLAQKGTASVINNRIEGAAVGIAASDTDFAYALIAMNMILGAKNGGIRALNSEELIGKDLSHGGSEAFRNLAIVVNVSL